MLRVVQWLCAAEVAAVGLLGFLAPLSDGRSVSDYRLDAIVGASDPQWCEPCYNCLSTDPCSLEPPPGKECTKAGVRCPYIRDMREGLYTQVCGDWGNMYCSSETEVVNVACANEFECWCVQTAPFTYKCRKPNWWLGTRIPGATVDPTACVYLETPFDAFPVDCN